MISFKSTYQSLTLRRAAAQDLAAIMGLHECGLRDVSPGAFRPDSVDFFRQAIDCGRCVVADTDGSVVGYGALVLPEPGSSSLAAAVGMNQGAVAHVESAAVHRTMRGTGLHRQLIAWRVSRARAAGRQVILCTVSPHNAPSLRNLLAEGFHVRALTRFYGGYSRYVLVQGPPAVLSGAESGNAVIVDAADEDHCRSLLDDGWVGVAGRRRHCLELVFVR